MKPRSSSCRRKRRDDFGAGDECLAHFRIGDQIQVALAVARLDIFEAVPLLGHGEQDLREEVELLDVDAQLACLGAEEIAVGADDVAEVDELSRAANPLRGRRPS